MKKCQSGQNRFELLGHVIGKGVICLALGKMKAVVALLDHAFNLRSRWQLS